MNPMSNAPDLLIRQCVGQWSGMMRSRCVRCINRRAASGAWVRPDIQRFAVLWLTPHKLAIVFALNGYSSGSNSGMCISLLLFSPPKGSCFLDCLIIWATIGCFSGVDGVGLSVRWVS